jgi:hypothetical protein
MSTIFLSVGRGHEVNGSLRLAFRNVSSFVLDKERRVKAANCICSAWNCVHCSAFFQAKQSSTVVGDVDLSKPNKSCGINVVDSVDLSTPSDRGLAAPECVEKEECDHWFVRATGKTRPKTPPNEIRGQT